MATRQEIQAAWDLVRKVNLINDWLETVSPIAKGKIKANVFGEGKYALKVIGKRDMTFEEKKASIDKLLTSVQRLRNQLNSFLSVPEKVATVRNGLNAWGVDFEQLKGEKEELYNQSVHLKNGAAKATKDQELNNIGKWIDVNIPKLHLLRKE